MNESKTLVTLEDGRRISNPLIARWDVQVNTFRKRREQPPTTLDYAQGRSEPGSKEIMLNQWGRTQSGFIIPKKLATPPLFMKSGAPHMQSPKYAVKQHEKGNDILAIADHYRAIAEDEEQRSVPIEHRTVYQCTEEDTKALLGDGFPTDSFDQFGLLRNAFGSYAKSHGLSLRESKENIQHMKGLFPDEERFKNNDIAAYVRLGEVENGASICAEGRSLNGHGGGGCSLGMSDAPVSKVGEADSPKTVTFTQAKIKLERTLNDTGYSGAIPVVLKEYQASLENLE